MTRIQTERARWLAQNIVPLEPRLRSWLARHQVEGLDVDDIVQEAYARLAAVESVEAVYNPFSYLIQTAHSIICTHLRRSQVVSIRAVDDSELTRFECQEASPERCASDRDELRRVGEIVASFPKQVATVFTLRRVEGLSQRDTAARMNVSESTVEKHMAKGIRLFMDAIACSGISPRGASRPRNESNTGSDGRSRKQCAD
ncbi:sigma-70 family RNA polymerase sigma factor [Novosphingobium taihuense]|uniref:RNA polymerase sigma-70 factor (ECF subfamily) n=1 Tax=Novosphingobium taihuense TaxID=260085 RepID=A0A7W7A907_9SPHN|nr:sigma-70 family RNA polymerase sigma factor [Novosphingobium taihuense]MBB4611922.1 RNA polymerase sigma-70 factor (ECF subfamily) [Novosphingobium taihuense]TWH88724.1 RNA polymerase sigma-70 factor (ECF subfamily) [Novosphingobium taihuense]